jgi:aminoglycoside 2'-N-acetyltransferase I
MTLQVQTRSSAELSAGELEELQAWLTGAFDGEFEPGDWRHALGGTHVFIRDEQGLVSHAALVPRRFECRGSVLRVGYVEAVATRHDRRRQGRARTVMLKVGELIQRFYDIGALSTGDHDVYAPLGWQRWRGATYVAAAPTRCRTADDDDSVMILLTDRVPALDLRQDLIADWREDDIW